MEESKRKKYTNVCMFVLACVSPSQSVLTFEAVMIYYHAINSEKGEVRLVKEKVVGLMTH